jgi:hypothetical protein
MPHPPLRLARLVESTTPPGRGASHAVASAKIERSAARQCRGRGRRSSWSSLTPHPVKDSWRQRS